MSDDKLETIVPSTGNDDKLKPDPSPSPPSPTPPLPTTQITLTKLGSLTNRILSPSNINSSPISTTSSSSSHISPIKSSCNSSSSSTRRTFNICDILAKPSSLSVDSNNNTRLNHLIKKPKAHRFTDYTKIIHEKQTNNSNEITKKSVYPHSDDDDDEDDEHHDSLSDCDVSGKSTCFSFKIRSF
jgi:hypothetical protein